MGRRRRSPGNAPWSTRSTRSASSLRAALRPASTPSSTRAARSPWPATRRNTSGSRRRSPRRAGSGSARTTSASSINARRKSGSAPPPPRAALFTPHCAAVHPLRLADAIAAAATRAGAHIVEGADVVEVAPRRLTTTAGTVRADVIVLATEAYTSQVRGRHRDLLPIYSMMIGSEPLREAQWRRDRARRPADVHRGVTRHRLRPAHGRRPPRVRWTWRPLPLRVPGRRPTSTPTNGSVRRCVRRSSGCFPCSATSSSHTTGAGRSPRRVTGIRTSPTTEGSGLASAGGYVGDGVATANLAGRTLADLILGRDTDLTELPWVGHRSRTMGARAAALGGRQRRRRGGGTGGSRRGARRDPSPGCAGGPGRESSGRSPGVDRSAAERGVGDRGAVADRVDRVAGQHAAAPEQTAELPVRQPELGGVEGVLAVDPAGETVADERGVDGGEEALLLARVVADQRGDEARAERVVQGDRLVDRLGDDERRLRASPPTPTPCPARRGRGASPPARCDRRRPGASVTFVVNRSAGTCVSAPAVDVESGRGAEHARRRRRRRRGTSGRARRPGRTGCSRRSACCTPCGRASSSRWPRTARRRHRRPATSHAPPVPWSAHRCSGLAGDGAELGDRRARAAGDGEGEPGSANKRPAGGT